LNYNKTVFLEGDRVRILQKFGEWADDKTIDLPILDIITEGEGENERQYLKIAKITAPDDYIDVEEEDKLIIEIYRPAKVLSNEDLIYYEIGERYEVVSDDSGNKYHNGQEIVQNIILNSYDLLLSSVIFSSVFKTITITTPPDFSSLSIGDKIEVGNTVSNNGTYTISALDNQDIQFIITVNESLTDEVNDSNVSAAELYKVMQTGKNYAYINLKNEGDYYYRQRLMVSDVDNVDTSAIYIADKNFSEYNISAVWGQGRPLIVDEDTKEEYYPAMLRFSQSYIYGTNINNLSRFYPNNFEEADASFGDILRLKTRENFIRLFQRYKTGMIPIYRQIIIDNAQSSQVALSERLLNKPNYYSGEYGIDKYGSSLVSTDYGDYFIDTNNKAIVRVSLDGITNVSDTNNLSFWANQNIKETSYGYGCFNYENRNVIILVGHLEPNEEDSYDIVNKIVAYSESDKKFESFYGFTDAENMLFINGFLFTGYQGKYYIHDSAVRNNFYGEQQSSSVTTVFNGSLQLKKTYTAIEELSNGLWTGTITTGPLTNQETNLVLGDFQKKIGSYTINSKENKFNATIKRDVNSAGGKFQGDTMKGLYAQLALTNSLTTEQRLISVSLKYIPSPLTNM
jgi:hypothetical protein